MKSPRFVTIHLYCPKKYKTSKNKIDQFFSPDEDQSQFMLVSEKRFPMNFVQLRIRPWSDKKYEYLICMKYGKMPISLSEIHKNQCLIQFSRKNKNINANLFVKLS